MDGLRPEPDDIVLARDRGSTGFHGTGLDDLLVGAAVGTVVLTGVSLNLGVLDTAIEAANRGYRVVVATDCVASDPIEYAASVLREPLRHIAFLATLMQMWLERLESTGASFYEGSERVA